MREPPIWVKALLAGIAVLIWSTAMWCCINHG